MIRGASAILISLMILAMGRPFSTGVAPPVGVVRLSPATPVDTSSGWVVVALDVPIAVVEVDRETVVPFRVLHVGRTDREIDRATAIFVLRHHASTDSVTAVGHSTDEAGRFEVAFTLGQAGIWTWTASLYNVGSMNPQATILPAFTAVEPGPDAHLAETTPATQAPNGPGRIRIEDEALAPWRLEVPLGLKVLFENGSGYPVSIWIAEGGSFAEEVRLAPGHQTMWYSLVPGHHQFVVGPAPAFRVGTITVTGEP